MAMYPVRLTKILTSDAVCNMYVETVSAIPAVYSVPDIAAVISVHITDPSSARSFRNRRMCATIVAKRSTA